MLLNEIKLLLRETWIDYIIRINFCLARHTKDPIKKEYYTKKAFQLLNSIEFIEKDE